MQRSGEGIEDEAEVFQCYDAKQRCVAWFTQNHGTVTVAGFECNVAFRYLTFQHATVGERENGGTLRSKADRLPYINR